MIHSLSTGFRVLLTMIRVESAQNWLSWMPRTGIFPQARTPIGRSVADSTPSCRAGGLARRNAPAFLADKRNEANGAQVGLLHASVGSFHDLDEPLHAARTADRHDDRAAGRELIDKGHWHMTSARRGKDRVIGRPFGPAPRAVALDDLDIRIAEPLIRSRATSTNSCCRSMPTTLAATRLMRAAAYPDPAPTSNTLWLGAMPPAWIISATIYGWEVACPASIGSG